MAGNDIQVTACNLLEATSQCVAGALCYVIDFNLSEGPNSSVRLLMRSRRGRWIDAYQKLMKLLNFRLKTIPAANPLFKRLSKIGDSRDMTREANRLSEQARSERRSAEHISIWAIYFNPKEFPGLYVLREWRVVDGQEYAVKKFHSAATVEEARAGLPKGVYCLGRQPGDDPVIHEVWI